MAAVSSAIFAASALVGIGTTAKGMYDKSKAEKDAKRAAGRQDAANAAVAQANIDASLASKRQEELREKQMRLESKRAQRQLIREAQVARSNAVARAANAGAGVGPTGTDSVVTGGQQQVTSQVAYGTQTIGQNTDIGQGIFNESYNIFDANVRAAQYGSQSNYWGTQIGMAQAKANSASGLISLGQSIFNNSSTFAQVGTSLFGTTPAQGQWTTSVFKA